jgi:hypothetical protein
MKPVLSIIILLLLQSYTTGEPDIVGIWQAAGVPGKVSRMNLKKDGSFVVSTNNKVFSTGKYTFIDGMLTILEDTGCTDSTGTRIPGVYKPLFFAPDSFRLEVISDQCRGRKRAVEGSRHGRVKT